MNNKDIYKDTFIKSLAMETKNFTEDIKFNDVQEWDSIGHMTLISGLEESFSITFETDDIIDFSSYKKGQDILSKKYKVNF